MNGFDELFDLRFRYITLSAGSNGFTVNFVCIAGVENARDGRREYAELFA